MEIIYTISKKEINRRITAYTTLILSFFISSIIFSFNYISQYFNIFLYIALVVIILLFLSRIVVVKYFNSLLKTDVGLTSDYIRKNKTKYLIKNIKKIIIKKTTKGYTRETKLKFNNNTSTYINNSVDNIDELMVELQKYLPKKVIIKTIREPLNYDHPTFYFLLGILLSFISIKSMKFLFNTNEDYMKLTSYSISFFAIMIGIYFIAYKPIYKRDEKKGQIADYIWGGFYIIGATVILISNIF